MHRTRCHRANGFTLVEMLVALAIFATVMAGVSVVFISSMRAWETARANQSVFETGRAALQFMERDIASAFGSVDRDEMQTLVGTSRELIFVGMAENTGRWDVAYSDTARIAYVSWLDPNVAGQYLLLRLVVPDEDEIPSGEISEVVDAMIDDAVAAWGADDPEDFELTSNVLDLRFHYGTMTAEGGIVWADSEQDTSDGIDNDADGLIDEAGDGKDNDGDDGVDEYDEGWNASFMGKLPEIIEVYIAVRAEARMPTDETKKRVFRSTIYLPLGHRRPLPAVLQ